MKKLSAGDYYEEELQTFIHDSSEPMKQGKLIFELGSIYTVEYRNSRNSSSVLRLNCKVVVSDIAKKNVFRSMSIIEVLIGSDNSRRMDCSFAFIEEVFLEKMVMSGWYDCKLLRMNAEESTKIVCV